jgi:hypothetical protein
VLDGLMLLQEKIGNGDRTKVTGGDRANAS